MYKIAIPSYNRASKLCKNTLKLLKRDNIDFNIITIFVNDSQQKELYEKTINDFYPNSNINIEISNQKGIGKNRTFIRRYYNDNEKVVFLDDDIEEILEKEKNRCQNFNDLFLKGFDTCIEENATLWGIPLVDNHFFMKNTISTNLKYIGAVYGVILTQEAKKIEVDIDQWEDYLLSVEHFNLDKKVIRLNNYGIKSKWYSADGGICSAMGGKENRINMLDESAKELCRKYPNAMKVYYKKDGLPNIRLNWRYKVN